ncbi:hypothetical protein ACOJCM_15275 [Billgrantia sp. LNSP4103-1]|uniref:hypothetical protein n=1 Tax=Billgrantia sp. LNSP4103-1 TaxID=3410266 RepID=UPI00403F406E
MNAAPTAERLSLLVGLLALMLATVPRYLAGDHDNRLALITIAMVVVAGAAVMTWRLLDAGERARLPRLARRLGVALLAGLALMGLWHALFTAWLSWQLLIAHAATLGLLLHALWLWWRPAP